MIKYDFDIVFKCSKCPAYVVVDADSLEEAAVKFQPKNIKGSNITLDMETCLVCEEQLYNVL